MAPVPAERSAIRRAAGLAAAALLAASLLGVLPAAAAAGALVTPDGCTTVSLTSPADLKVHVTVADCGDPDETGSFGVAVSLTQDATGSPVEGSGWGSAVPVVGTLVDEDVVVPAQGAYTLTVDAFSTTAGGAPADYHVTVAGGEAVTVGRPVLGFRLARMSGSAYPAKVTWANTSLNPTFGYRYRKSDNGTWGAWTFTYRTSFDLTVAPGHAYQFEVKGLNLSQAEGPVATSAVFTPRGYGELNSRITYTGTWRTSYDRRHWGGRTRYSTTAGSKARVAFYGREIAIVAPMGPTRGSFRVYADGEFRMTVKTWSSGTIYRQVVYLLRWTEPGAHTLTMRVNGTAGHPRVDLDGVLVIQ